MFFRTGSPQNLVLVLFMALGVTAGPVGRLTVELEQTLQHIVEKTGTENDESGRSDRLLLSVILRDFSILLQDIAVAIEREALQGEMSEGSVEEIIGEQEELEEEENNENIGSNDENIEHVANNDEHDENVPSFGEHAHVQPNADHNEGYFLATDDLVPGEGLEEVDEETVEEKEEEEEEEEEGMEAKSNDGSLDNGFPVLSQYLPPSAGQSATDHGPESNENIATNDENNEMENVATNDENNDENDENIANNEENNERTVTNDENNENIVTNDENNEIENVASNDENNDDNDENIANNDENDEDIFSNEENDEDIFSNEENDKNIDSNNENDKNIDSNNENDNIVNNMPSLEDYEEEGTPLDENHLGDEASQPAATDDAVDDGSVISTDDFASAGSSREWSPFDENVATLGRGGPSVSVQRPHTHVGRHDGDSEAADDATGRQPFSGRWSPFSNDAPSFGKHPPHPHARPSSRHLPPHSPVNSQPEVQQARWLELINKMRKPKANPASIAGRWSPFDKNPPTFGRNPAG